MNVMISVEMTLKRRAESARRLLRWRGWAVRAVGAAYLAWCLLSRSAPLGIIGVLLMLGPELRAVLMQYVVARKYGRTYRYTLSDDGVRIVTAITDLQFVWSALTSLREYRNGWTFRFPGGAGFTLPKADFSPEQDAEWRAFVAARQLVKV